MDRWKSRGGKSMEESEKRREEERRSERERVGRKKMQVREKVEKSRFTVFFQITEGRKVGSLKRRVRSHLARWEMKKCTPLWLEAISKSKRTKHTILGALLRIEMPKKVHAVVARSTYRSQNAQSTPFSDHFWKLRRGKSARRCGAKHILKSKC